jgi:predicted Zn-dependent protease
LSLLFFSFSFLFVPFSSPTQNPSGLFKFARTEDELAAVLAHELSHVLCRHLGEKITSSSLGSIFAALLTIFFGGGYDVINITKQLGFDLPNSREMEREADQVSLYILNAACFDVSKSPEVFERMEKDMKQLVGVPTFLSTHPSNDERVAKMKEWGKKVKSTMHVDNCAEIKEEWRIVEQERMRRRRIIADRLFGRY